MSAREGALERYRSQARAQHAADEGALTLEELPHILAARAARSDRIPAVGALTARGLAAQHGQPLTTVEHAAQDARDLLLGELAAHAHAELAREPAHGALQA